MSGHDRRDELRAQFESTKANFEATSARIEQKAGRNLFVAIGSALIFAALFLGSLFFIEQLFIIFLIGLDRKSVV